VGLRTPTQHAEQIKIQHGSVIVEGAAAEKTIPVPSVADRPPKTIQQKLLSEIILARYEELFALVLSELRRSGFEDFISAGIVLSGGASNVTGAVGLAESVFQLPCRLGMPQYVAGLIDVRQNPSYATSVGLLLHGYQQLNEGLPRLYLERGMSSLWARMKNWCSSNF
jgi:Actin-like ATPase involved in cell division